HNSAYANFLPYGISDHSPAILNCLGVVRKKLKSIRLANYITENEEFSDIVETGWKKNVNGHAMYQLAKVEWLKNGDRNSSYFHKVLRGKLNRSKIHTVMGTDGLIHEKDQVGMQFVKYFESFLGSISDVEKMKEKDECLFNKIDDSDAESMIKEVNEEEIKRALLI
nr:RNA-directed DNA polymerase, eukaryota, reverse transcriptase zinc-binding domain protein [Tanacetum cinerariifolium]